MSLLLLYGYGKKLKKKGCIGWDQCPNCKKSGTLMFSEHFKNINVYFIPIVKWGKKNYLVCENCDAAYELNEEQKEYYYNKMIKNPGADVDKCLLNSIDDTFSKITLTASNFESSFNKCVNNACVIYNDKESRKIILILF